MRKLLNKSLLSNIRFQQSYLLKNARIVNADLSEHGDVLIENGKIAQISSSITHKTAEVIDCTNKLIIPGGIDTHTHMQLPFMGAYAVDDFDIGSKAAIAGGTTSFIDFAIPSQTESMSVAYERWRGWADPKVNCDYSLHATITSWNDQTPG
jgi:dihydropyrimidinase